MQFSFLNFLKDKRLTNEVERAFEELSKKYYDSTYPHERKDLIEQFQAQFPDQFRIEHQIERTSKGDYCAVNLIGLDNKLIKQCCSDYRSDFDHFKRRLPTPKPVPIPYEEPHPDLLAVEKNLARLPTLLLTSGLLTLFSVLWVMKRPDELGFETVDRSVMALGTGALMTLSYGWYHMQELEKKYNHLNFFHGPFINEVIHRRNEEIMDEWQKEQKYQEKLKQKYKFT